MNARIVATGAFLPGDPITNEDVERLVGPLPDGLLAGMHMVQRHWIVDPATGEHTDSTSAMAAKATTQALERAGLEPTDLDLLIVSTASPDYILPPAVTLVQEQLGIPRCATFELRSGGAGVVQGLDIARLYIEAGIHRTAAVIGVDSISPVQAQIFRGHEKRIKTRDRLMTYMFGDGAGAIVLQAGDEPGVVGSAISCIGTGRAPGMELRGGSGTHKPYGEMLPNGRPVDLWIDIDVASTFTATLTTEALHGVLEATGVDPATIDLVVTPEADTEWMAQALEDGVPYADTWAALGDKIHNALPVVGAPGSAALPLGLDDAWVNGLLEPGNRLLLVGMETTKWIYAAMLVEWTAPAPAGVRSAA